MTIERSRARAAAELAVMAAIILCLAVAVALLLAALLWVPAARGAPGDRPEDWVLAVYVNGDLAHVSAHRTESACHVEGTYQVTVRGSIRRRAMYRCAPRRFYRPL
jgi:hypothetical protein